jgi:hypothetical protein
MTTPERILERARLYGSMPWLTLDKKLALVREEGLASLSPEQQREVLAVLEAEHRGHSTLRPKAR